MTSFNVFLHVIVRSICHSEYGLHVILSVSEESDCPMRYFKYMGNYSAVFSRIKIPPAFGGGVRGVEKLP